MIDWIKYYLPNSEITKEQVKEIVERYPFLIPRNVWTGEIVEDYDYDYFVGQHEIPNGWIKLFLQMCEDIRQPLINANYLNEFRFSQVKEKYATLRAYNFGAPAEVQNIIRKYEYLSEFVCEDCGAPATCQSRGWITSLCDDCATKTKYNVNKLEFDPIYKIKIFHANKPEEIKEIDCSDEWNRLWE